ncbi:hypothetical protein Pcinc_031634 [Petrolisthes cinctipes]|uniref:Uncharacterized protein n=1 Tax=Petrolisthes cinctipes TaxID=88211 RepID=A0AAE1K2C0_PETCI|nr:hypothetical protein Pcinc_031634 [Petrolisthes cinctipes]
MCQPTIAEVNPGTSQSGLFLGQTGRDGLGLWSGRGKKSRNEEGGVGVKEEGRRRNEKGGVSVKPGRGKKSRSEKGGVGVKEGREKINRNDKVKCCKRKRDAVFGKKKSPPKRSSTYTRNPFFSPSPGPPVLSSQDPTSDLTSTPFSPIYPPAASNCPIHSSLAFTTVTETSSTHYPYRPLPSSPSSPPSTPTNSHPRPSSPHTSSSVSPPHTPSPSPSRTSPRPTTSSPTPPLAAHPSTPPQLPSTSSLTSFPPSMFLFLPSSPFRPLIGQASPSEPSHIKQQVTILDDEGCDEVDFPLPPPPSPTQQPDSNRAPSDEDEEWPQVPDLTPEGDLIVVPPTTASPPCPRLPPRLPIHSSPSHAHKRPSIKRTHSRRFTQLNYLKNVVPVLPKRPVQSPLYQSQPSLHTYKPALHNLQHLQRQSHQFSPIAPPEQLHSCKSHSSLFASDKSHSSISSQPSLPPIVKPFQMCWKSKSKSLSRPVCSSQSQSSLHPAVAGKSLNPSDKAHPKSNSEENLTATNPFLSAALRDVIKSGVASEGLRAAKAALRSPEHLILQVAPTSVDCKEQGYITKIRMPAPEECTPVTRKVKGRITKVMLP